MYKVVAINSSKRKKFTYGVMKQVSDILIQHQIEVEFVHLFDYQIDSCIGCECCILKGDCVRKDEMQLLMKKLEDCDGIILSSPVYLQSVSGMLKTFLDRTCVWFHRKALSGKPMLTISTTKGSGLEGTLDYLDCVVTQWGGYQTGRIGRTIRNVDHAVSEKECQKFIESIQMDKSDYKPRWESVKNYQVQKVLSRKLVDLDRKYWDERGWDKQVYYFDCRINPLKKVGGNLLYSFLNRVIKAVD
ncbi:MAG TPA: flavodoxin family protein [Firmicutes bacterium]|nr:flavodoxin family protein [Bacillota bacterium]